MGIVTVSAAYGAAGTEVAPAVAERLGLAFHDRAIPAQVAGRLGVPVAEAEANDETVVRGLWRLVESLGTMPDPVGAVVPGAPLPVAIEPSAPIRPAEAVADVAVAFAY